MNERWSIQLFGGLRIRQSERLITRFRTQKTGALLAFLAYHREHSHAREVLIEMFWPDTSPESGRHNLSHALSSLRNQLEPPGVPAGSVIIADRFSVELNPEAFTTDVADFEQALRAATQARNTPEQAPLLTLALEKYNGPLLPDYYEDWIAPEQERLAQRFQQAASQLIDVLERAGDPESALEIAQRAVSLDPLREEAIRESMRLLTATGQFEAALRQYREYERVLDQELGEEPGSTLSKMALQIEAQLAQNRPTLDLHAVAAAPTVMPCVPAQPALPCGTVTVLLTDIEGSTALWEKAGDAFRSALSTHHAVLRREFRRNGGQEVKEAGDSFLVVFAAVADALPCAIACQRSLDMQPWPEEVGSLRVRMALHTGDVELEEGEYHGLMLHRAARMLSVAHGGQILCSEATTGLLIKDLDPQVQLKDLGVWRLRDVEEPERMFQAVYPGIAIEEFPPLNASPAHHTHLPLQFTRFFGRDVEIAQIVELLATPRTRLLTLTGPAGTGKTRLCIEAAGRFSETFAGAVWFVPLADLSDAGLIPQTILQAMSIPLTGSQEPLDQLVAALANQSALLLLDNFEQLVANGAEVVQTLLSRVPTLQCVVTSRQTLSLPGEVEYALEPLPTPHGSSEHPNTQTPERLTMFESVRLFVDRAQAAKPDFRITNSNAPAVAELCDRLEGMPLAIELAAARALVLTPSQMLVQLGSRFEFLVSRKRGIAERQRTLRAAVDWSYRLLSPDLQRFFAQLCVFRGGWTLEAAEAVCEEPMALDMLAQLRECSLVSTQESESGIRFRMLESLREYAEEQLSEEARFSARARHAEFFLAEAEKVEPHLAGPDQAAWFQHLETEHDNFRAALSWYSTAGDGAETGLRMSGALWQFWMVRGHLSEGRAHLKRTLGRVEAQASKTARAKALYGVGVLSYAQGDFAAAREWFESGLALNRELGNTEGIACSLNDLGLVARAQGDSVAALSMFEESLALQREVGDKQGIAHSLTNCGHIAREQGDHTSARTLYAEGLELHKELGDKWGIALSLNNVGLMAQMKGDYSAARSLYEESLMISRDLGDTRGIAFSFGDLGHLVRAQGEYTTARSLLQESLVRMREVGDKRGIADSLTTLGYVIADQGEYALAKTYHEESLAIFREIGDPGGIALALINIGNGAYLQGNYASARKYYEESLSIRREIGDQEVIAYSLIAVGDVAYYQGDYASAQLHYEESMAISRKIGYRRNIAYLLNRLGNVEVKQGDFASALARYEESLPISMEIGDKQCIAISLEAFANLAAAQENAERAARLWGAAEARREEIGLPLPPNEREEYDRKVVESRKALGVKAFAAAWAKGRAMTLEHATALAMQASTE